MKIAKLVVVVGLFVTVGQHPPARAQDIPLGGPVGAQQALAGPMAANGEPFGVLIAELPLPPGLKDRRPRVLVEEADGRVFYPVVSIRTMEVVEEAPRGGLGIGRRGGLIDRVRSAIRGDGKKRQVPVAVSVAALYRGTGPLELRLSGDIDQRMRIAPSEANADRSRLLARWWSEYTASAAKDLQEEDFPKLVHKYLTAMLSQRLSLPHVDLDPPDPDKEELSQPLKTLSLLAAIEPLRDAIFEEALQQTGDGSPADMPVPAEPVWKKPVLPPLPPANPELEIEALASRIPPECFYLRFGSFGNYVWFQDIAERYGGDLAQAVLLRGFNYDASARMERMLAAKMTAIAKMFGDNLIGDMAVIGNDLYMKEGASLGVVFYAKNPTLLNAAIEADRKRVAAQTKDATLQQLTIEGKQVQLLSTPDNRVRSFYVSDGSYVFMTTSQALATRFLQVAAGDRSLADSTDFRWARTWMPEANQYSVFGYFSPEFFHRLVSPQYQIELRRRLQAIAHLEMAEMASQAASAEGIAADDIGQLQRAGLLSSAVNGRAAQAPILRGDGQWLDSLRGTRGSFLPIADVPLHSVTRQEAEMYAKVADFYQNEWRHMDPMLVGLRRFQAGRGAIEKVTFEGYIAPFEAEKYGWIARQLSDPSPLTIVQPRDDVASLQLHLRGAAGLAPQVGDYHLFAGVKDMEVPSSEDTQGFLKILLALRTVPAYLGAWPKPGLIEQLPLGLGRALAQPDYAGFSRMLGGLWRWQDGSFSLLSFNRSIIEGAIPELAVVEAADSAQARLQVADLSGSKLAGWINDKWYQRGWRSSHGNVRLLDAVHQQLKVPSEQCLATAQRLLDVRLQCPLGGEYQFLPQPAGAGGWWTSSAWTEAGTTSTGQLVRAGGYQAPWIEWFRGGRVHVTQRPSSLAVVGEFELEMQPLSTIPDQEAAPALPSLNFDLFSLPGKLFGGSGQPEPKVRRKSF